MAKIKVIGLGPGSLNDLTVEAYRNINDENINYLRTEYHPTVEYFKDGGIAYSSFDYLYEEEENFEDIYETIVEELISSAKENKLINYFVPGNPMIAEKTVELLLARRAELEIELISGMSFIEPMLELVERDPIDGLKIIDGAQFKSSLVDINSDIIVTQTYNMRILIDIKLEISEIYGDEYEIYLIHAAGIEGLERLEELSIYELDRIEDVGHLTSLYIPKVEKTAKKVFDFNDLVDIMILLRGENGCPWDIEQTHTSLRSYVIEEAYELVNAIDEDDIDNIIEELGDVLLQVLFHTSIASDEGSFNFYDVSTKLAEKLIYRHPHIFSENELVNSDEVMYNWEAMKDKERKLVKVSEKMENLTLNLPSLVKACKIQDTASKIGFDWSDITGALEKLEEEIEELLEAYQEGNKEDIEEELGDVLFTIVNVSRFLDMDPELALNKANNKFKKRFASLEEITLERNLDLKDMEIEELDGLWDLVKTREC